MKHAICSLVFVFALVGMVSSAQAGGEVYEERTLHGWNILIEPGLAEDDASLDPMLAKLDAQLSEIADRVPEPQLSVLRQTPFWLVETDPYADEFDLLGLFFYSREWLEANGYDPAKHLGIQFNKRFGVESSQNIVFHELAHSFHARVIGLENARLQNLYEFTLATTNRARDRCPRNGAIYAFSNVDEFFATFSQAYFGGTCAYPNNRNLLRLKHPEMLAYLEEMWGF